ncbi:putative glycosyl transferase protein [Corchorus capsularis]|uniref:Putative glycosyl transferase protein n=1 Tax=Corchorus capsularis TaxID=210143 RepID=A0A1R3KDL6_COCAP|nr:putative glycosyl transferase protein [Corchorus capsularis]
MRKKNIINSRRVEAIHAPDAAMADAKNFTFVVAQTKTDGMAIGKLRN